MAIPNRTMREIRTLSGKVDRIANPYMAYMQITCLEMEKCRKGREKASALQRVQNIDARLHDIEAEKATILRALVERGAAQPVAVPGAETTPSAGRTTKGLKLRY